MIVAGRTMIVVINDLCVILLGIWFVSWLLDRVIRVVVGLIILVGGALVSDIRDLVMPACIDAAAFFRGPLGSVGALVSNVASFGQRARSNSWWAERPGEPARVAVGVVNGMLYVLPATERSRYGAEYLAELHYLREEAASQRAQLAYALRAAMTMGSLRRALTTEVLGKEPVR